LRKTFNFNVSFINILLETQGKNIIRKKFYFQALLEFVKYCRVIKNHMDKRGLIMGPQTFDEATCPNCQSELIYIEHYQSYYCSSCDEHFKVSDELPQQAPKTAASTPSETDILTELLGPQESQAPPSESPREQKGYERPPPPQGYEEYQESPPSTEQPQYEETPDTQEYEEPQYEEEQVAQEYEESQYEEPRDTREYEEEYQEPQEPVYEEESQGIMDEDYETQVEADSSQQEPESEEDILESKAKGEGKKRKMKFKNYRYRTRMIKGSLLPIIFGLISFQMINSSRLQFPDYYELEAMIILAGFILGFSTISSITAVYLIKAKKRDKKGYKMNMKVGVVAYLPFIAIFLGLTLFVSLSTGWKFATGFFLASVFPVLIVMLFEATSKGKFFVKEAVNDPSWGRKLVFKS
jgi:uncharacterized protein YbaR (Trm112 family)